MCIESARRALQTTVAAVLLEAVHSVPVLLDAAAVCLH